MTTVTDSLPEPLLSVARTTARLIASGSAGTTGQGSTRYNYRRGLQEHREAFLRVMQGVVEVETRGRLTLREADASLYRSAPPRNSILLTLCDASRPSRPVTVLRSSDMLYALTTSSGTSDGIGVSIARAKGH